MGGHLFAGNKLSLHFSFLSFYTQSCLIPLLLSVCFFPPIEAKKTDKQGEHVPSGQKHWLEVWEGIEACRNITAWPLNPDQLSMAVDIKQMWHILPHTPSSRWAESRFYSYFFSITAARSLPGSSATQQRTNMFVSADFTWLYIFKKNMKINEWIKNISDIWSWMKIFWRTQGNKPPFRLSCYCWGDSVTGFKL